MKVVVGAVLMLLVSFTAMPSRADEAKGAALFHANCMMCHGSDASGNTAIGKQNKIKDLKSPEVQKQSDAKLAEIISKGKKHQRPSSTQYGPARSSHRRRYS
jgi:mono/diheme cytochrome c family protein